MQEELPKWVEHYGNLWLNKHLEIDNAEFESTEFESTEFESTEFESTVRKEFREGIDEIKRVDLQILKNQLTSATRNVNRFRNRAIHSSMQR